MTNVMRSAWEIAYEGVEKFGGKVKEYFAAALRIAWDLFKKGGSKMENGVNGTIKHLTLPELKGTEKQVAWANTIRQDAIAEMKDEVVFEDWKEGQPKRNISQLVNALTSEESIQSYLDGRPDFLLKNTIVSMNNALDRYARFLEVVAETDAKFWIDNRGNQVKNHGFNNFKAYVSNGVKKF